MRSANLFVLLFVTCVSTNNQTYHLENRMKGGRLVNNNDYLYTVAVLDKSKNQACAGAILSNQAVLSIAKCVGSESEYTVVAGHLYISQGTTYNIQKKELQPGTGVTKLVILILKETITNPKIIILPTENCKHGLYSNTLGWSTDAVSTYLLYMSLPILFYLMQYLIITSDHC